MERVKKFLKESGDLKHQVADTLAGEILKAAHTIRIVYLMEANYC